MRRPRARGASRRVVRLGARRVAASITLWLAILAGCRWSPGSAAPREETAAADAGEPVRTPPGPLVARGPAPGETLSFESPFVAVANRVLPAVVSIDTERRFRHSSDLSLRPPQRDLFRELFPDADREFLIPSAGSGFVIDPEGIVVTNNHVVEGSDRIQVTFVGGETAPAEVVGLDPGTDIAVLRVEGRRRLPALRLGDSDAVRVGDWAIAIGNPFGKLEGSVTVGVVSAKGRADLEIEGGAPALQDFIQTDASINFGNSGGPLVDIHGEVIGMNTAINPTGQGIGFAIPARLLRRTVDELLAHGRVVRGYLGIYPQDLTPDLAEGKGLHDVQGVLVGQVLRETPAARAGLEVGDVIVRLDGRPTSSVSVFRMLVAEATIGKRLEMQVLRDGKTLALEVVLVERPERGRAGAEEEPRTPVEEARLGLEVAEITREVRRDLGIDEGVEGVVIRSVQDGSPAERAGLEEGFVILEVGDRPVRTLAEFESAVSSERETGRPIVLLVRVDETTRFVAVRPD